MSAKNSAKAARIPKTITVDPDLHRAVMLAIEGEMAHDFSEAVALGLHMLLHSHGYSSSVTPHDLRSMITRDEFIISSDPDPREALKAIREADATTAPAPQNPAIDKGDKMSNESKLSKGRYEHKDPQIEAIRKKIKKPKK